MPVLSDDDIEQFVDDGYVALRSAFPVEVARRCRVEVARQLDIDLDRPTTWDRPVVRGLARGEAFDEAAGSARLLGAIGQLLDPDRWVGRRDLGAFVVRFPGDEDPGDAGWHIDSSYTADDGRWFVNYRSRERGLLLLCLVSEVGVDDAPTLLLPGSHRAMPALLLHAGEEGLPGAYAGQHPAVPLPDTSGPVVPATGAAGDVFLCHPFLVHAASWPHRGSAPRFVSQPPISIVGSLGLTGAPRRLSPVARAVRRGLEEGGIHLGADGARGAPALRPAETPPLAP